MAGERISEEAVEAAHGESVTKYTRSSTRRMLQAAYPAILSDLRRELEAEATAKAICDKHQPMSLSRAESIVRTALDAVLSNDSEGGSE